MGFAGILAASIATNLVVAIALKGIVLSGPVYDCTSAQWYASRFASMAKALLATMPLVAIYALAPRFLHHPPVRFMVTNLIGLVYMMVGIRWIVSRNSRVV
jgi:hypothetical protein